MPVFALLSGLPGLAPSAPARFFAQRALPAFLACLLAAASLFGCASPETETRWSRHFDVTVVGGAFGQQIHRPDRLGPEAVLLATIPASLIYDTDIADHYAKHTIDPSTKGISTGLQVLLPVIPVTVGIVDWSRGDGGRNFEVTAESLGGVVAVQQLLAYTVERRRPNRRDTTSFPSGHTSWVFAASTLIIRDLHDPDDHSFHFVDGLIYAPAIWSGWERIAANKHWASDVTCGALLGVLLTNLVWDAHFRGSDKTRPTVYMDEGRRGVAWRPTIDVIDGQPAIGIQVGF